MVSIFSGTSLSSAAFFADFPLNGWTPANNMYETQANA
jgi:hypothetical protein